MRHTLLLIFLAAAATSLGTRAAGMPEAFVLVYDRPLDGLNYFSQTGFIYTEFQSLAFDHLLEEDPRTGEFKPSLAERFEISKDGKTFTFHLRKDAKFHDGAPVTATDVKFSWEAHKDPKYKSIKATSFHHDVKVEATGPHTVRFTAPYRSATLLRGLGSWPAILPAHHYGDFSNEGKWAKHALGSGPYRIHSFEVGKKIVLERNSDWWGFRLPENRDRYKFPRVVYRFVSDLIVATELLKKGEAHYVRYYEPSDFAQLTGGFGSSGEAIGVKTSLYQMKGTRNVDLNMRDPLLRDSRIRLALQYLFDREEINRKMYDGSLKLGVGYWHQENPAADRALKPVPYDPKRGAAILREAGWADSDKNGILDREIDGKKTELRFTVLNTKASREKLLTLFKEALAKGGIDIEIRTLEAQNVFRLVNEGNYSASYGPSAFTWGTLFPTDELHSRFANGPNPSNWLGYSNPEADKLLESADAEFDTKKRNRILRKARPHIGSATKGLKRLPKVPPDDNFRPTSTSPKERRLHATKLPSDDGTRSYCDKKRSACRLIPARYRAQSRV